MAHEGGATATHEGQSTCSSDYDPYAEMPRFTEDRDGMAALSYNWERMAALILQLQYAVFAEIA